MMNKNSNVVFSSSHWGELYMDCENTVVWFLLFGFCDLALRYCAYSTCQHYNSADHFVSPYEAIQDDCRTVRFRVREMERSSFSPRPSTRSPSLAAFSMKFASTVLTGSI